MDWGFSLGDGRTGGLGILGKIKGAFYEVLLGRVCGQS